MSQPVLYPVFTQCQNRTTNQFWRDVLYLCACGRFPPGIQYDPLKHAFQNDDGDILSLPSNNKKLFLETKHFFQRSGIHSETDLTLKDREGIENTPKAIQAKEWKDVKPKNRRERLLSDYITQLCSERKLGRKRSNVVKVELSLAFKMKMLLTSDVQFDGKVTGIKNFSLDDDNNCIFSRKPTSRGKDTKPKESRRVDREIDRYLKRHSSNVLQSSAGV